MLDKRSSIIVDSAISAASALGTVRRHPRRFLQTIKESFISFINKRSRVEWGLLLLFYLTLYGFLAGIFATTLSVFLLTLPPTPDNFTHTQIATHTPRWTNNIATALTFNHKSLQTSLDCTRETFSNGTCSLDVVIKMNRLAGVLRFPPFQSEQNMIVICRTTTPTITFLQCDSDFMCSESTLTQNGTSFVTLDIPTGSKFPFSATLKVGLGRIPEPQTTVHSNVLCTTNHTLVKERNAELTLSFTNIEDE